MLTLKTIVVKAGASAICSLLLLSAAFARADDRAPREFDIRPQSLAAALSEFARQADQEILFAPQLVAEKKFEGIRGKYTPLGALQEMLEGTGLGFSTTESGTILIQGPGTNDAGLGRASAGTSIDFLSGTGSAHGDVRRGFWARFFQSEDDEVSAGASAPASSSGPSQGGAEKKDTQQRVELEEIVVVGTNIRGVYPSSSPVETYTAEDIARSGATTTEQFVQKLPQNLASLTQNATAGTRAGNRDAVNNIDLRGLGIGTTLVLLNGRRLPLAASGRSADISMIPAAAIERVEVLTDGASAIYGSDAIGGVVNFVLRDDFEGAETRLSYGEVSRGSLRQGSVTQTLGNDWQSGNGLVSLDYYSASSLEYDERDFSQGVAPGTHTPRDTRANILGTFRQDITDRTEMSGDLAYMRRDVKRDATSRVASNPLVDNYTLYRSRTDEYFTNLGLSHAFNDVVTATFTASYSNLEVDGHNFFRLINQSSTPPTIQPTAGDVSYSALDLTGQVSGTLMRVPAGDLRFSAGLGQLDEEYNVLSRRTSYLFGEVFLPVLAPNQHIPMIDRLELSLAARYTSFEDAGEDTVPKVGVLWAPIPSLALRATYGESFRAPSLSQLDPAGATNQLQPQIIGVTAPAPYLRVLGPSANLEPETAETATIGFDFQPDWVGGFRLSGTYFKVDYTAQIARVPLNGSPFLNPAGNPDLFYPAPSAAFIEALLRSTTNSLNTTGLPINFSDPAGAAATLFANPNFRIFDDRFRNLSLSGVEGFDLSISSDFDTYIGRVDVGVQVTRVLEFNKQSSPSAPIVISVDRALNPADLRGRAFASLSDGGFSGTLNVNYVDDYMNTVAFGGPATVESWTTVDLNLTYDFGLKGGGNLLDGTRLALSVQNLMDEDPPFLGTGSGQDVLVTAIGFDPANANPLGRLITLSIRKVW